MIINNDLTMISGKEFKDKLKELDKEFLYHANTRTTMETFLSEKKISSRAHGAVNNYKQTNQKSDKIDFNLGILDYIFLDFTDLHDKLGNVNFYGPYLLKLNVDLINDNDELLITRENPFVKNKINWIKDKNSGNISIDNFISLDDIDEDFFERSTHSNMIMLYRKEIKLKESDNLEIICDKVSFDDGDISLNSYRDLNREFGSDNITFSQRECPDSCKCMEYYEGKYEDKINSEWDLAFFDKIFGDLGADKYFLDKINTFK